jgi:hypothetical protein
LEILKAGKGKTVLAQAKAMVLSMAKFLVFNSTIIEEKSRSNMQRADDVAGLNVFTHLSHGDKEC